MATKSRVFANAHGLDRNDIYAQFAIVPYQYMAELDCDDALALVERRNKDRGTRN
jgi:hypothetical protein